jgi:hypothetical protein
LVVLAGLTWNPPVGLLALSRFRLSWPAPRAVDRLNIRLINFKSACRPLYLYQRVVIIIGSIRISGCSCQFADPATSRQGVALKSAASLTGYQRLLKWAEVSVERRWAVAKLEVWCAFWRSGCWPAVRWLKT